jgi:hypothetical protein
MASMKNRLMFSKSDPMTVSESLMEKKSERLRKYRDELYEELKKKSLEYKERLWQDILRDMYGKDGKK